jgi:hypothetical protein
MDNNKKNAETSKLKKLNYFRVKHDEPSGWGQFSSNDHYLNLKNPENHDLLHRFKDHTIDMDEEFFKRFTDHKCTGPGPSPNPNQSMASGELPNREPTNPPPQPPQPRPLSQDNQSVSQNYQRVMQCQKNSKKNESLTKILTNKRAFISQLQRNAIPITAAHDDSLPEHFAEMRSSDCQKNSDDGDSSLFELERGSERPKANKTRHNLRQPTGDTNFGQEISERANYTVSTFLQTTWQ